MHTDQQILDFMNDHTLMVISTVNAEGGPQSAVVGFGSTDKFELVMGTSQDSRKGKAIANNPNVSVVIGWDPKAGTIQYEGTATKLEGEAAEKYSELYFAKNETARRFKDNPGQAYYLIKPMWLRFTDTSVVPWVVTEKEF